MNKIAVPALCRVLFALVAIALWCEHADAGGKSPLLFGPTVVATGGGSTVHVEGLGDLPSTLRLVLAPGEREGVDYIDFVLIKPEGAVSVAGEKMEVTPFYIATTELSVGAARTVLQGTSLIADLYARPTEEYYRFDLNAVPLATFERLRGDDQMPYMPDSIDHVAIILQLLSFKIGLQPRLPTTAEWIAAADIDDENLTELVGQAVSEPESPWALHLQPVASGAANPNGLRHVWGNVGEYVRPSFEEAARFSAQIRSLRPHGSGAAVNNELHLNGVRFSQDRLLYFGGAVDDSHEGMTRCMRDAFIPSSVGVAPFLPYPVGIRPVLDLAMPMRNAQNAD